MEIPLFATKASAAYQRNGSLPGPNTYSNLDKSSADQELAAINDQFSRWKALDESAEDLLKGQIGAVRVTGAAENEFQEACLSRGQEGQEQLQIYNNIPSQTAGLIFYHEMTRHHETAENLAVMQLQSDPKVVKTRLTHIDHQISSDGPIAIGSGSTSVALKDRAFGGYLVTPNAG